MVAQLKTAIPAEVQSVDLKLAVDQFDNYELRIKDAAFPSICLGQDAGIAKSKTQ